MADRSDVEAKNWYIKKLEKEGYMIVGYDPVDIVAKKDGEEYYFELKTQDPRKTKKTDSQPNKTKKKRKRRKMKKSYTGMISLKQLRCAIENEDNFRLVFLRIKDQKENGKNTYYCKELTLKEFLPHLSGSWRIEYNFHFNLEIDKTDHMEIESGSRKDADAVRSEIKDPTKILKQINDRINVNQ